MEGKGKSRRHSGIDKAKPDRKYKRRKLGGGQAYDRSSD
jgi:hypothetical protein